MNSNTIVNNSVDYSLRELMLRLYNYTTLGIMLSGLTAYLTYSTGLTALLGSFMWIFILAPLGLIIWFSFSHENWSLDFLKIFYFFFTAIFGVSLSIIFSIYTAISIAQVFFITASTFATASLYGYLTKRDLTSFGNFLFVGLIGIIIASIVNIFLQSSALEFAVSIIGVLVFTGLTAYETQAAKSEFVSNRLSLEEKNKFSIIMAISLYLNFINLYQMLLSLLGEE